MRWKTSLPYSWISVSTAWAAGIGSTCSSGDGSALCMVLASPIEMHERFGCDDQKGATMARWKKQGPQPCEVNAAGWHIPLAPERAETAPGFEDNVSVTLVFFPCLHCSVARDDEEMK